MPYDPDPGPPPRAEEEFCACQPPSTAEYIRASAAASAWIVLGGGLWLGLTLLLQQTSALTSMLIALSPGWIIHWAAGRHRSLALGILAAVAGAGACLAGFGLLWLPALGRLPIPRQLDWYHLSLLGLGLLAGFGKVAPKNRNSRIQ